MNNNKSFTFKEFREKHQLLPSPFFALVGKNTELSRAAIAHNALMKTYGQKGFYFKLSLEEKELSPFFSLVKSRPFKGLSITMPYKEKVLPFLDSLSPEAKRMQAVNTIVKSKTQLVGYNTDGAGAMKALETKISIEGKTILIIGAGGAARAIAYAAAEKKGKTVILNRNPNKAIKIANEIEAQGAGLDELRKFYQSGLVTVC